MFDPVIRGKMEIKKYKYDFEKKKTVDLVRWLTPTSPGRATTRFLVVFSDGIIAFYHKDKEVQSLDPEKDYIKIKGDQYVSRSTLIKRLKGFVEDYSFDE